MPFGSYAFLYDDLLEDRRYERLIADIESRLTTLDVRGEVSHLTLFQSAKTLAQNLVRQGASTIVLVGNDHTLDKVMWFAPDLPVTFAYIPVCAPSHVADLLGIPVGLGACDVIAARYIEELDVGRLDDRYFLTQVVVPQTTAAVSIEGAYQISAPESGSLVIQNLGSSNGESSSQCIQRAKDGRLDVIMTPRDPNASRWRKSGLKPTTIPIHTGEIISTDPIDVQVDNHVVNGFRFKVSIAPGKLKMITGRGRKVTLDPERAQFGRRNDRAHLTYLAK